MQHLQDERAQELPEGEEQENLALDAPQDTKGRAKWNKLRLPRFTDQNQQRAFMNILRFFALVLVLTLVARGTAGVTLAGVETTSISAGEVSEKVSGEALVSAGGSHGVQTPAELTIEEMMVSAGQTVEKGEGLVRFKADEVATALAKERALLAEMQQEKEQLDSSTAYDPTMLQGAKDALKWAQQDRDSAYTKGAADLVAAQGAVDSAITALNTAWEKRNALPGSATKEEREADKQAVGEAENRLATARTALENTKVTVPENQLAADRKLESETKALESATINDANKRQSEADVAAQNSAKAGSKQLEIEAQEKKIKVLEGISADGQLLADAAGVVLETAEGGSKTDGSPVVKISNVSGGYEAEAQLSKADAELLDAGMEVEVGTEGGNLYYSPTVQGKLLSLSKPDEAGQVKAMIRLPKGEWKIGQSVSIDILRSKKEYQSTVPVSALHQNSDGYYLLLMEERSGVMGTENRVRQVSVSLLAKDETLAAVEGAFEYNAKVIKSSSKPVEQNDKVRVRDT